jgi:hypothetical protein
MRLGICMLSASPILEPGGYGPLLCSPLHDAELWLRVIAQIQVRYGYGFRFFCNLMQLLALENMACVLQWLAYALLAVSCLSLVQPEA